LGGLGYAKDCSRVHSRRSARSVPFREQRLASRPRMPKLTDFQTVDLCEQAMDTYIEQDKGALALAKK